MSKAPATKATEPQVHIIQKVIAGDTYLVMADSSLTVEDEYQGLYYSANSSSNIVLIPPYEPKILARLPNMNNVLSQCIEAMEVNIDGTGHEILPAINGEKADVNETKVAEDFFAEPYPGKSFIQIRRRMRRDLEAIGMAYLEVLSTVDGTLAAVRNLDTSLTRMVRLDDAVATQKTLMRNGAEVTLTIMERERRYVQKVGTKFVYYKDFGASRELHRDTGAWAIAGEIIPIADRGTEVIQFGVNPDVETPYSVPRWINQLPSVLGSRKAEEANLEYFDAGGMPPAIIFVQGGTLAKNASDQLRGYLSGQAKNRQRAVVVEAQSTTGDLNSSGGGVQIRVERFGSEKLNDSMYQKYDVAAEDHVRAGFRLPKLFLGRSDDYNYATAVVAYMVAEAQVFGPERSEFDDIINKTIMKRLGFKTVMYSSKPITLKNVDTQLTAIGMLKGLVKDSDFVEEINKVSGLALTYDAATAEAGKAIAAAIAAPAAAPATDAVGKPTPPKDPGGKSPDTKGPIFKAEVVTLAQRYAQSRGLLAVKNDFSDQDEVDIDTAVAALKGEDLLVFNRVLATYAFRTPGVQIGHEAECC